MAVDQAKVDAIRTRFAPVIGSKFVRYQTAEYLHSDGTWSGWPDLPMRLYGNQNSLVSVAWSRFDDLWLTNDETLPFAAEHATFRWVDNGLPMINECLGRSFHHVMIGRGSFQVEDRDIEIWTRLVIDFGDCWLEVFNALDENGYTLHNAMPSGEFVHCV